MYCPGNEAGARFYSRICSWRFQSNLVAVARHSGYERDLIPFRIEWEIKKREE